MFKSIVLMLPACICGAAMLHAGPTITLQNNHPFPVLMPVRVHDAVSNDSPWLTLDREPVQQLGHDIVLMADLGPNGSGSTRRVKLLRGTPDAQAAAFKMEPDIVGVQLTYYGHAVGRLSWELDEHRVPAVKGETNEPQDFDANFKPLSSRI